MNRLEMMLMADGSTGASKYRKDIIVCMAVFCA